MINLSFAGCGFLGIYHVGVASCFREYAPHVLVSKIAGASVGSIAAAALICNVSLGQTTTDILSVAVKARSQTLGPLNPRFDLNRILREKLENALPENAHQLCSGRLFISVTRWHDKQNALLSQFNSRQELIQALLCSCYIPFYSGLGKPSFQGVEYVDGGMTDNLPILDDNTVTVSPFAGEHDICPQDESYHILQVNLANTSIAVSAGNIYRFYRILFPPKPEILSKMCQQGFDDALKFLQRKNVITCTRCLDIQSVVKLGEDDLMSTCRQTPHDSDNCLECRYKRQMASLGNLPDTVVDAIQEACDQVNKGVVNWLYRRRPVRLMSFLALPYTIPLDVSIVIFAKLWDQLPSLRKEMLSKFHTIIDLIKLMLNRLDPEKKIYSAMFSCELEITEFDYPPEERVDSSNRFSNHSTPPHQSCTVKTETEVQRRRKISVSPIQSPIETMRLKRKSYAGLANSFQTPERQQERRKSFSEISRPERVIRNMKFGFSVGVTSEVSRNDKKKDFFQSLKSLGEEESDLNIVDITNKALKMEREYIKRYMNRTNDKEGLNVFEGTVQPEAIMRYSYIDEDQTLKMHEIYNVTDADTSMVLSDEERTVNSNLQWENEWVDPPQPRPAVQQNSITDTLDDDEFVTSDNECSASNSDNNCDESFELEGVTTENNLNIERPQRKQSFVIMN